MSKSIEEMEFDGEQKHGPRGEYLGEDVDFEGYQPPIMSDELDAIDHLAEMRETVLPLAQEARSQGAYAYPIRCAPGSARPYPTEYVKTSPVDAGMVCSHYNEQRSCPYKQKHKEATCGRRRTVRRERLWEERPSAVSNVL